MSRRPLARKDLRFTRRRPTLERLELRAMLTLPAAPSITGLPLDIGHSAAVAGNLSNTASFQMVVDPTNDPSVIGIGGAVKHVANGFAVRVASLATITNVDSVNFDRGMLTVTNAVGFERTDQIMFRDQGTGPGQIGIRENNVSYGGVMIGRMQEASKGEQVQGHGNSPLRVKLNQNATPQAVQALLRQLVFRTLSERPLPHARKITVELSNSFAEEPHVYKTVEGRDLSLFVSKPPEWQAGDKRPAVVFFGGSWFHNGTQRNDEFARYLNSRGMVCIQTEFRLVDPDNSDCPDDTVADCKSAMRWVRAHAEQLGIDPHRIAASGASAGGGLSAIAGMVDGLNDPDDDLSVSAKANALILWNPIVDMSPGHWGQQYVHERYPEFSPAENVDRNDPPAIIFHGTADVIEPQALIDGFRSKMLAAGVRCDVIYYRGQGHGFFNSDRANGEFSYRTQLAADEFLHSLGWLQGRPTLRMPVAYAVALEAKGAAGLPQPAVRVANDVPVAAARNDAVKPARIQIAAPITTAASHANAGAQSGIALTAVSHRLGRSDHRLRTGSSALLPARTPIHGLPNPDGGGSVELYYRPWEQTHSSPDEMVKPNDQVGDRTAAFRMTKGNAVLQVSPVNDRPVLTLTGNLAYQHDAPAVLLAPQARVNDLDSAEFAGGQLRVRIIDGAAESSRLGIGGAFTVDDQNQVLQGTAVVGRQVTNDFGLNELAIVFYRPATPAVVQALLRAVTFKTVNGVAGKRTVSFTVSDGDGGISDAALKTVFVG
jgi:acetyl esterase/lipase